MNGGVAVARESDDDEDEEDGDDDGDDDDDDDEDEDEDDDEDNDNNAEEEEDEEVGNPGISPPNLHPAVAAVYTGTTSDFESLVGFTLTKMFPSPRWKGYMEQFEGRVTAWWGPEKEKPTRENVLFHITYEEDGDEEDVTLKELAALDPVPASSGKTGGT